jgi:hypothetical protein
MAKRQCKAKTNSGRCRAAAADSGYCFAHDPDRAKERRAAQKLGGFNRRTAARVSGDAVKIESLADVLRLVNAVITDTWNQENTASRSRALLACADTAIRSLQAGEMEARLAAIEAALGIGGKAQKEDRNDEQS